MEANIGRVHSRIVHATSLAQTITDALYEDRDGDVLGALQILIEHLGDTGDMAEVLAGKEDAAERAEQAHKAAQAKITKGIVTSEVPR